MTSDPRSDAVPEQTRRRPVAADAVTTGATEPSGPGPLGGQHPDGQPGRGPDGVTTAAAPRAAAPPAALDQQRWAAPPEQVQPTRTSEQPQQRQVGDAPPQQPPVGSAPPQQSPVGYGQPQQSPAGYAQPQQLPVGYAQPQQLPVGYAQPQQPPAGYAQPQQPPAASNQPQQAPAAYNQPQQPPAGYAQPYPMAQHHQQQPVSSPYQPAPVQVAGPAPALAPPVGPPPWGPRRSRPVLLEILVTVIGGLLASAFVVLMAVVTDGAAVGVAVLCALVPLAMLVAVIVWVDRWEPEPRFLLVAAFLWGGGVAVAVASLLNALVGVTVAGIVTPDMDPLVAPAVFGAPIVEEAMKGLGILVIFLLRRREFNGPVDGVVYAAVVATGFAVVEDIQYFAMSADDLGLVFVMRALLSPFGHLIYSVPMGIALGIASRRRSRASWVWLLPLGYLVGVGLHMAWNAGASQAASLGDIALLFVLVNWLPLALTAALVIWLRRRESAVVATRLQDYVGTGWVTAAEAQSLASMRANLAARRWAERLGPGARQAMRRYQRAAVELAYARQDLYTGHAGNRARLDEMVLLEDMARSRAEVMGRAAPQPV